MNVPGWPVGWVGWQPGYDTTRLVRCRHDWERVRAVVYVIGEPGSSYNARCTRCGRTAWLHWRPRDPVLEQEC